MHALISQVPKRRENARIILPTNVALIPWSDDHKRAETVSLRAEPEKKKKKTYLKLALCELFLESVFEASGAD